MRWRCPPTCHTGCRRRSRVGLVGDSVWPLPSAGGEIERMREQRIAARVNQQVGCETAEVVQFDSETPADRIVERRETQLTPIFVERPADIKKPPAVGEELRRSMQECSRLQRHQHERAAGRRHRVNAMRLRRLLGANDK